MLVRVRVLASRAVNNNNKSISLSFLGISFLGGTDCVCSKLAHDILQSLLIFFDERVDLFVFVGQVLVLFYRCCVDLLQLGVINL